MDANEWSKEFSITSVTREDLVAAGFSKEIVEKLNDDDMRRIASIMEDVYCDRAQGYWDDLRYSVNRVLEIFHEHPTGKEKRND